MAIGLGFINHLQYILSVCSFLTILISNHGFQKASHLLKTPIRYRYISTESNGKRIEISLNYGEQQDDDSLEGNLAKRIRKAMVISSLGLAIGGFIPSGSIRSTVALASDLYVSGAFSSSSLIMSEALNSKSAVVSKSVDKKAASPAVAPAPKLPEEVALDAAIEKKNAGKARQDVLASEIKLDQSKIGTYKLELNGLVNDVKKLDTKLLKVTELKGITTSSEFDDSQKKIEKALNADKAALQKKVSEVMTRPPRPHQMYLFISLTSAND